MYSSKITEGERVLLSKLNQAPDLLLSNFDIEIKAVLKGRLIEDMKWQADCFKTHMLQHLKKLCRAGAYFYACKSDDPKFNQYREEMQNELRQLEQLFSLRPRESTNTKVVAALNAFSSLSPQQKIMIAKMIKSEICCSETDICSLFKAQVDSVYSDKEYRSHVEAVNKIFNEFSNNPQDNLSKIQIYLKMTPTNSHQHIRNLSISKSKESHTKELKTSPEKSYSAMDFVRTGATAAGTLVAWYYSPQLFGKGLMERVTGTAIASAVVSSTVKKLTG